MELARILIFGDSHLSSKNYGAHVDYPAESLRILHKITEKAKETQATHIIGLGDFSYGRFLSLEYREAVEKELSIQREICNGQRYEIKGNHDVASYGMTEYEYYVSKGTLLPATNLQIGPVNISMIPSRKFEETEVIIEDTQEKINVILMHDFFKFKDTPLNDFGAAQILDNFTKWYGVDHIIGGHVHSENVFEGSMINGENPDGTLHGHAVTVDYVGCMMRPAYLGDKTDKVGHMILLTITDDGMKYDRLDIPLENIEEVFNVKQKQLEKEKKEAKEQRVDISDIVKQLDEHERNVGNPEDIIMGLQGVDEKYKEKAIELLKIGQA